MELETGLSTYVFKNKGKRKEKIVKSLTRQDRSNKVQENKLVKDKQGKRGKTNKCMSFNRAG